MNEENDVELSGLSLKDLNVSTPGDLVKSNSGLKDPLKYINDVDVTLDFKVGEARLSVGALRDLKPGSSFALTRDQGLCVEIYLNQHLIGEGMLVDVDGALGVQVSRIVNE